MNSETTLLEPSEKQEAKHTAKDSVFTDLFAIPKYLLQLYRALHPEDQEITEENISNVTIHNVLLDQCYNDLGFLVGNRLLVLAEAQSTWTVNILVRSLMYLVQTWQEYVQSTGQNIYGSKRVELPRPELYVIYTGSRKRRPAYLRLSDEIFSGHECAVEVKVKMIYDGEKGDIISQYVAFTRIYNEQMKKYGRTRRAVLETIQICRDENILKEYLESREKEVVNIMMTLFDDEYILKTYIAEKEKEAAEKAFKKAVKKAEKVAQEASKKAAVRLHQKGMPVADIADALSVTEKEVEEWLGLIRR